MPIVTIWEPRRYVAGFNSTGTNTAAAAGVRGIDHKVREVPRFEGETVQRYAEAGEMALTLYGVSAADVRPGYLLELEGSHYMIERFEFYDDGQACDVEGRSIEALLDKEHDCYDVPGQFYGGAAGQEWYYGQYATVDTCSILLRTYMGTRTSNPPNMVASGYPNKAGWWRDPQRRTAEAPTGVLISSQKGNAYAAEGTGYVRDFATYGAHLRTLAAYFGLGYKFDLVWDSALQLYKFTVHVYDRPNSGVVLRSGDAGISEFRYALDHRDRVNTVIYSYSDHVSAAGVYNPDGGEHMHYGIESRAGFMPVGSTPGEVANMAEWAENMDSTHVDLGAVPESTDGVQIDGNASQTAAWVQAQIAEKVAGEFAAGVETVEFEYNNEGAYKLDRHFGLGSPVALLDDATGYASTQVLTAVTTAYSAGEAKGYSFEFGHRQRTTAEKVLTMFNDANRRTATFRR